MASEHFLNVVNSQWVAAAILVVLVNIPRRSLEARPLLVGLSSLLLGFCGIEACLIFPVALLYAVAWKSRPHAVIAASLLACCLVQGALIVSHPIESRFQPMTLAGYAVAPFLQIAAKHLLGIEAERRLADWYRLGPMATGALTPFLVMPLAMLAGLVGLIFRGDRSDTRVLAASLVLLLGLNEVGAVGDRNAMVGIYMMRYFFVPSLMAALLLAKARSGSRPSLIRQGALWVALIVSTADFFGNDYNEPIVTMHHAWRRDVDQCRLRSGPCHIAISPEGFEAVLPPTEP